MTKNAVVIFDIDKTLIKDDFHAMVINEWKLDSKFKKHLILAIDFLIKLLPSKFVRRRFEYFQLIFINEFFIRKVTNSLLANESVLNRMVHKRLVQYRKKGIEVILVTAGPDKTSKYLADHFKVEFYSSRLFCGLIRTDLLGKKINVYNTIQNEHGKFVKTVYSDSPLDFFYGARNLLVIDGKISSAIIS